MPFPLVGKYFKAGRQMAGLEVLLQPDGSYLMHLVRLGAEGTVVRIVDQHTDIVSLDALADLVPGNVPVYLVVNGKGILNRRVAATPGREAGNDIGALLPNAKATDFYLQEYPGSAGRFITVIRQSNLNALLDALVDKGLWVVWVGLGPYVVCSLLPLMERPPAELSFAGHQLAFDRSELTECLYADGAGLEGHVVVGEERIGKGYLIAYAAGLQAVLPAASAASLAVPRVESRREVFGQAKALRQVAALVTGGLLLALLVNFSLYRRYYDQHRQLQAKQAVGDGLLRRLDSLQQKVGEQEAFLTHAGWTGFARTAPYTDQLAASVPATVRLTELTVNPLDEKQYRTDRKMTFENHQMRLAGTCSKPTDLNPWVRYIESFKWVKAVEIRNYTFDDKAREGHFNITITIKP